MSIMFQIKITSFVDSEQHVDVARSQFELQNRKIGNHFVNLMIFQEDFYFQLVYMILFITTFHKNCILIYAFSGDC